MKKLNRDQIARRVAADIPEGAYVNLGIDLPTKVANFLPPDREIILHSENGVLGMDQPQFPVKRIGISSTPAPAREAGKDDGTARVRCIGHWSRQSSGE